MQGYLNQPETTLEKLINFITSIQMLLRCTIGIPHPKRGESTKVYIILNQGETASKNEMIEFAKDKHAKYKWAIEIKFM